MSDTHTQTALGNGVGGGGSGAGGPAPEDKATLRAISEKIGKVRAGLDELEAQVEKAKMKHSPSIDDLMDEYGH